MNIFTAFFLLSPFRFGPESTLSDVESLREGFLAKGMKGGVKNDINTQETKHSEAPRDCAGEPLPLGLPTSHLRLRRNGTVF